VLIRLLKKDNTLDKKLYDAIILDNLQFMRRFELIESYKDFGFSFSTHKKGFLVTKVMTSHCLREFTLVFPMLDNAIFFVDGYIFNVSIYKDKNFGLDKDNPPTKPKVH
jgi:hypothetical protein